MSKIRVLSQEIPLARYLLKKLRSKDTNIIEFRKAMIDSGKILAIEASKELIWKESKITTPLNKEAIELDLVSEPLLIGVLGAALPLLEGFMDIYPSAPIGLVAARRNESNESIVIDIYYKRLPENYHGVAFIIDPMLATGKTMDKIIKELQRLNTEKIVIASVISSTPGINYITSIHNNITIYTLAIDEELDNNFFIVPGLGDAGDRGLGIVPD